MSANELAILKILVEAYTPDEWGAYSFAPLAGQTKLGVKDVRRACRSLAKKGFAEYANALWNEDGPAGAGYHATEKGAAFIDPCDMCGSRATYDYEIDAAGKYPWDVGFDSSTARHVRECEEHHGKSVAPVATQPLSV